MLNIARVSRAEAITDAMEWLHSANDPGCNAYVGPWMVTGIEDGMISTARTAGPADWQAELDAQGNMVVHDDAPMT